MDIPHIKQHLTITTVLQHYGLKPDRNHRLHCPFHDDKTPSMQVYSKTNTVFCFSANCKLHGKAIDCIDFILHKEGCTKHQAIKKAEELTGFILPTNLQAMPPAAAKPADLNSTFKQLQTNFKKSPQAELYVQQRSLNPEALGIGYNTATISSLKHCIVFPLKDKDENIVSLYGRSIFNNTHQKHYYQTGRSGLYPGYPRYYTKKLILTESIIDAATLLQMHDVADNYAVLACYGTNGFTDEHKEAISQLKQLNEIVFAFDNDDAGKAASEKYAAELHEQLPNIIITSLQLPCKDVNETAVAHDSKQLFIDLFNERTVLFSPDIKPMQAISPTLTENKTETIPAETTHQADNTTVQTEPTFIQASPPNGGRLEGLGTEQVHYNSEHLLITLLGGISLQNLDRMRVTLYLRRNPHINAPQSIRQSFDLYNDDQVEKFIRKAAEKLDHSTTLINTAIAQLTEDVETWRIKQVENKKLKVKTKKMLTPSEQQEALSNLKRNDLMQWTLETLTNTGIIGESKNAMIIFTAMTSRLYEDPVSVICLSQSGTGKTYLLERVVKCFPAEDVIENTQFTDNSFYYWKEGLKGKAIIIEDMEGAQNVEYTIRELISKKYITKTTVHKDAKGNMQTVQHRVEGPASFLGCTTREKIYEDNANRCILIYLDSSKEQDEKIMAYQKQVRAGAIDKTTEEQNRVLLQNMQTLLQTKKVINPYATLIDLPAAVLKPRRSIGILLSFIEAITLYHQFQCETDESGQILITHPTHIEWGFALLKESLFRKSDELSAALRNFLEELKELLTKEKKKSFFAIDIRKHSRISPRTLRKYLWELSDYGYIIVTGGNKYRKGYEYELSETGKDNTLKTSIDKHIETVLRNIWVQYNTKGE
jgi:DNA primase